ncbi:MAG: hypothetical protein J5755_04200, partial [Clostridia bacterium]|nr:hypothetical protein [Clostridia bacterium]
MMKLARRITGIAIPLVTFAVAFLLAALFPQGNLVGGRGDYLITLFLVLLTFLWGITMSYRVQYPKLGRVIVAMQLLCYVWLVLRFVKWLVNIPTLALYVDYLYYTPMVAIPTLVLIFCVDNFYPRLPRRKVLLTVLWGMVAVFALFALTNDLHHLVYRDIWFEPDVGVGLVMHYRYHVVHYVAMGYISALIAAILTVIVLGTRRQASLRYVWIPSLVVALAVAYYVSYALGVPFVRNTLFVKDFALVTMLFLHLVLELLLDMGLVQNNGRYVADFRRLMLPMCIYDEDGRPLYVGEGFVQPTDLDEKTRYNVSSIGYYTVSVQEDLSEVVALRQKLSAEESELEETNRLLGGRVQVAAESAQLTYQLALTDEIEKSIGKERVEMLALVAALPDSVTPEEDGEARRNLGRIALSLGYMKQKCMLLLGAKEQKSLSPEAFNLFLSVMAH